MKSSICSLTLFLPLLLLLLAATEPSLGADVVDVDGLPVTTNSTYYILPLVRGNGGGLSLGPRNASLNCPLYVTQEDQELERGIPVRFYPVNVSSDANVTVQESTDLNVEFRVFTICVQSTVWRLGGVEDPATEQRRLVRISGVKGNPGSQTLNNWFKIEKDEQGNYKMVFCPTVCDTCRPVCGDLGVFFDTDGRRFLGLSPTITALRVVFKKV